MSGVRSRALGPPLRLFAVLLAAGVATTVSCASTDNGATWATRASVYGPGGLSTRSFCSI